MAQRTLIDTVFPGGNANPITYFSTIANRGAVQQVTNVAESSVITTACFVSDDGGTVYPADHWVRWKAAANWASGAFIDGLVRITTASTAYVNWEPAQGTTGSALNWRTSNTTSGSIATPTLTIAAAAGDIFELWCVGQNYSCFHTPVSTGVQYQVSGAAFNDAGAHVTTGHGGFGCRTPTIANAGISRWTAGDFLGSNAWPILMRRPNILLRM